MSQAPFQPAAWQYLEGAKYY